MRSNLKLNNYKTQIIRFWYEYINILVEDTLSMSRLVNRHINAALINKFYARLGDY